MWSFPIFSFGIRLGFFDGHRLAFGQGHFPRNFAEAGLPSDPAQFPTTWESFADAAARLTRRQGEIALLVARGLSNRQIASELTISENTVANHVASIARKLNAPSRSRIAVWVTERGLREVG